MCRIPSQGAIRHFLAAGSAGQSRQPDRARLGRGKADLDRALRRSRQRAGCGRAPRGAVGAAPGRCRSHQDPFPDRRRGGRTQHHRRTDAWRPGWKPRPCSSSRAIWTAWRSRHESTRATSPAIRDGQDATFTVDAFPGRSFSAKVKQIRMAPQVLSNVVTYTVVSEDRQSGRHAAARHDRDGQYRDATDAARRRFRLRRCATSPTVVAPRRRCGAVVRIRCGCCGTARRSRFRSPRVRKTDERRGLIGAAFVRPMSSSSVKSRAPKSRRDPTTRDADRTWTGRTLLSAGRRDMVPGLRATSLTTSIRGIRRHPRTVRVRQSRP